MLELELDGLLDWCEEFEIDSSDFVADSEFQSALLEAIKQRGQCQLSAPVGMITSGHVTGGDNKVVLL